MTLLELYQSYRTEGSKGEKARELLTQTHWFTINADFDPKSGDALPQLLSVFLSKVSNEKPCDKLQDRLYRIMEHARPAAERLFRTLNESPRREHAQLPVRAVRELDAGSFIKLSARPGRNIREKLANKPYLQAVRRFQSINLPENRLLKAYVTRLAELLELRKDYLDEEEDELLPRIQSWLLSDEVKTIGRWDNLSPNNTLLSHRDYRRIWDSWRRLQTLDEDIKYDLTRLDFRSKTMQYWINYAHIFREGTHLFAEIPILFDYEKFIIKTWSPEPIIQSVSQRITRSFDKKAILQPVCVDLTEIRPHYAVTKKDYQVLNENFLWQRWSNETEHVDIALFNSDAVYIHPDATSIALPDLFFSSDKSTTDFLDRAARTFAAQLRKTFKDNKIVWLTPDFLNEFELEIIRRNLNAHFPDAEPLPRSVAAVFAQVDYSKITSDYVVVVIDTIGGVTSATKLIAKYDKRIKKCLPETHGFYWERCPPVILSRRDTKQAMEEELRYKMITVDSNDQWFDAAPSAQPQTIKQSILKKNPFIGIFDHRIDVNQSPVVGGIRLHALQEKAGGIPLWRDQIPVLRLKGIKDGHYQPIDLVSRDTTVEPIRGEPVPIPVKDSFILLQAGKSYYQFPLFQGENDDKIGFSARLDSPLFPLKQDMMYNLNLTFEYGVDEPYKLFFIPLDKSFPALRATWWRTKELIITDAPAPDYPEPKMWFDLRREPKRDSEGTSDLLDWSIQGLKRLDHILFIQPSQRNIGKVVQGWFMDRNGYHFARAECEEVDPLVFIHESNFMEDVDFMDFPEGSLLSFELCLDRNDKPFGREIAEPYYREEIQLRNLSESATDKIVKGIHRGLYFPIIEIWRDGRSITDKHCPKIFREEAEEQILHLSDLVDMTEIPEPIRERLLFLLACLHKDAPEVCFQWIADQVENGNIHNSRAIGFSHGDLSQEWQRSIFRKLSSHPNRMAIKVFAYAIWRERHFFEHFSLNELKALLNSLSHQLQNIKKVKAIKNKWALAREIAEPLELLLGLLRTRESVDPDIRMLLQPHQKITTELADRLDQVNAIVVKSNIKLFSRVQIDVQKPDGVRTPELLYALQLYLTGDDAANAIHITSIFEDDKQSSSLTETL
ncbi:MAG: DNA-binding protein [bacterium]